MNEFFLESVLGVVILGVFASAIWSTLSRIPLAWRWEYHLNDSEAGNFPETQGFSKNLSNNQWYRKGMPWCNTKEVAEDEIDFETGRGYKLFLTRWLRKKVFFYRRRGAKTVKTYIMYYDADYS